VPSLQGGAVHAVVEPAKVAAGSVSGVLLDRHQPRRRRMGGVGAAHDPLAALLVPQPDMTEPGARLDFSQRPTPAAAGHHAVPALELRRWPRSSGQTGHGSPHSGR
jgi:hypothetical protein